MQLLKWPAALPGLVLCARLAIAADFETARWIAPPASFAPNAACPLVRKEFVVARKPHNASLRIVGLGDYDLRVNGRRVTVTGMNQPWSQYEKTIYYRDFDVTKFLVSGTNCVAMMLFNSIWNNPNPPEGRYNKQGPQRKAGEPFRLCAELTIREKDGSVSRIGSDETWRAATGPITFSHNYAGEDFDARLQIPGWDQARFDDRSWPPVRVLGAPPGRLEKQFFPGIGEFGRQKPVSVKKDKTGMAEDVGFQQTTL